ncbi:Bax inhibitor-1/YccA family protein [Kitasatospora sp. NPDC058965]|uniref:Bax inhibitor-1/YccA family protein n=1 Tax=Kitasatospora sp. NPDC058965 TaxID=3346682 RepID=UPI0036A62B1D
MRTSNPVFSRGPYERRSADRAPYLDERGADRLEQLYRAPAAGPAATGRMTMDDVVLSTALSLLVLVAAAAAAWVALPAGSYGVAGLAALAAFAVGLVLSFRQRAAPALVLLYAALEGFFLGAVTKALEAVWPGIAVQAVVGTAAVFAGMLLAHRVGWIKVTARYARIGTAVAVGFLVLLLVNLVAGLFGASPGLDSGPLGIVVGLVGVGLGAFFLSLDFAAVQDAVGRGAPRAEAWRAAFGLTLSLVWIYLELLRLIAVLRGDD